MFDACEVRVCVLWGVCVPCVVISVQCCCLVSKVTSVSLPAASWASGQTAPPSPPSHIEHPPPAPDCFYTVTHSSSQRQCSLLVKVPPPPTLALPANVITIIITTLYIIHINVIIMIITYMLSMTLQKKEKTQCCTFLDILKKYKKVFL